MKPARSQLQFLGTVLVWTVLLQGIMLWYLNGDSAFVCNSKGAWPFSSLPFLGSALLVALLVIGLAYWAWKTLETEGKGEGIYLPALAWGLIIGAGLSHALERISSDCVLDYWHLNIYIQTVSFNLGDVSLTIGTLFLIGFWFFGYRHKV